MSALILTSDSLIGSPSSGNIEYSGQFYGTDTNNSRGQFKRYVQGTVQNSTSGTAIDFTGIPAWAKRVTVMFYGISTNGTSVVIIQLGTGATPTWTTTGYIGSAQTNASIATFTTGIALNGVRNAAYTNYGSVMITNITGNTWVASGTLGDTAGGVNCNFTGAGIALAAALTAVRITTVNGTDLFDAGQVNIHYEG